MWLATDTLLTRQVAVKVLKPALAADPVVAERFRREAVAVAGLSHPNIVAIYDTVDEAGRQAVVMQYVPGRSLRQILDEDATLSPEFTMRIGSAVAAALDVAHAAGLVHRDVKPGNILVTPEGRVLLTDFGIAKTSSGADSDLTSDNVMMGTAKYLSPEQVRGRRLDGRADLYSLGLVLYECLSGRVPFLGENDAATALARLQRDPTPLGRLRPTLPAGLSELIHRLLSRNPDERPASGAVVRSQLERIRSAGDDPTSPTPVPGEARPGAGRSTGSTPRSGGAPRPTGPRAQTPRSGGVSRPVARIPGEPASAGTPRSTSTGRPRQVSPRDPTPSAGLRVTGRPARQFQQRRTPSLVVVGGLLAAAAILLIVLFGALGDDDDPQSADGSPATETAAPITTLAGQPAEILNVTSYDPNGDDGGVENEDQIPLVQDGADSTSWMTACYADRYLGSKGGVGVVIELSTASKGALEVVFGALPWAVDIYAADEVPGTLQAWGGKIADSYSTEQTRARFDLGPTPHKYVLVLLRELGTSDGNCSVDNPYRGRIAELSFTPA